MPNFTLPSWLDVRAIEEALACAVAPDTARLKGILDKSRALRPLTLAETATLMRVTTPDGLLAIMRAADEVKQRVYGDRIVLSAPLHLTNHCGSECLYCANRKGNDMVQRKYMTSPRSAKPGASSSVRDTSAFFWSAGSCPTPMWNTWPRR